MQTDTQVYEIGCLNMEIYQCISTRYVTDKVIITRKQLLHIKKRHPEAYQVTIRFIREILNRPDYIIKDKKPDSGLVIRRMDSGHTHSLPVLRLVTSQKDGYKNSIITGWEISDDRLKNYLKNREILYRRE